MIDKTKILLVEDDTDLGDSLKQFVELEGHQVQLCRDGTAALVFLKKNSVDLCILDVMLPDISGFDIAQEIIKDRPDLPFLFLTARQQKLDRLTGLRLGADDYITKPFEADELLLRIRNILKRTGLKSHKNAFIGKFTFDYENLLVTDGNEKFILTEKEASLLNYLAQHPNQLLKRGKILQDLWGEDDYFLGRSLDVFISRLRKVLKSDSSVSINTIRGVGFVFGIK